jgi:cytochrome oxidase Cu insertion factor (SCO1/SenC/PrrC family)
LKRILLVCIFLAATPLCASVTPALENAAPVPDAQVLDASGHDASLRSLLAAMGAGPVIVLPIYTRCTLSCPLQTQKLKQALAGPNAGSVRVVAFSFDPEETEKTIQQYRTREGVPENWLVVRAPASAVSGFFDFFHYPVLDESGQLTHPDQMFLLDPSLHWRFTVDGLNWSATEVNQALGETRSPGAVLWLRTHPDALAWSGFLLILVGISLLGAWLAFYKPSHHSQPI